MRAAIYARVSTPRQARARYIDDQVERLKAYAEHKGFRLEEEHVYLDEGYSGASLNRPGLDTLRDAPAGCACGMRLRDAAAMAEFEVLCWLPRRTGWRASTSTKCCSSRNCRGAAVG